MAKDKNYMLRYFIHIMKNYTFMGFYFAWILFGAVIFFVGYVFKQPVPEEFIIFFITYTLIVAFASPLIYLVMRIDSMRLHKLLFWDLVDYKTMMGARNRFIDKIKKDKEKKDGKKKTKR